jgi:hypothetical protein
MAVFLALVALAMLSILVVVLPFGLIFWIITIGQFGLGSAIGGVVLGMLLLIPLVIITTIFVSAFTAALHSELTGGWAEAIEEIFA